ncbi:MULTISPECIES: biotin/lipoyl-binding protein [unclassified Agrobacterium]|uniref:HlyD family secretion protein n=1 Tax=unclassified Agrobacterium TaxID=2632611 RepID=UPI00244A9649|nr:MULTISPECIES: biotin/lipoyl-binding protein [unclassified Agrobacterium]MDH0617026.1 biotin/lipoyl-binding protein [Agrobacterium sp. GD03872]MDH0699784.1 biotin/lipoyl-binding protein [Agrobacterium sp. GD03871]MDH1061022.1 biotin/lipoyl-binding protein [Agrobacterium sp. GD03992]MDH2211562.1 biotin/lipoyl-binding protein [Agrobacterium sp. GD03643]MDH2221191.1 biotin/lipoyl-binding protein [Agrobacterium sp. GD03638]
MIELILCSLVTIFPDYLFRRYVQGKRIGREITLYSVWFELRWGIVTCLMLTVTMLTAIFYSHPSTTNVAMRYRTIAIAPDAAGRVAEVYLGLSGEVKAGDPIFRLDSSTQDAAVEAARRAVAEVDAAIIAAKSDVAAAEGKIQEARGAEQQAADELDIKQGLNRRNPDAVATREIVRLENIVDGRRGAVIAATAARDAAEAKITTLLPAQKASAEQALVQAEVEKNKTIIRAGVDGRVEQFTLRVGDVVNPLLRPAGVLIPTAQREVLVAGFGQIEAQVIKVGMVAEATCISKPWTVIPMVVTGKQDHIAAGQFRGGEQLIDPQQAMLPGTVQVLLEPVYKGGLDGVSPGSSCMANAYSSNHDLIASGKVGPVKSLVLHALDATAVVKGMILRNKALLLPFKTLIFNGN